jgi:predicted DCC family thiol-disulfide oxidoreductase YuxK
MHLAPDTVSVNAGDRAPVLLYDGECPLCDRIVRSALAHDRTGTMLFAPLQGTYAHQAMARHPALRGIDTAALIEYDAAGRDIAWLRSDVIIRIGRYARGPWRAAVLLRLVPRVLRDAGYALVARTRHTAFGRLDACPTPPPSHRARFLP